jgi:hypothetical protein
LNLKEAGVENVVDEYQRNGASLVEKMIAKHTEERNNDAKEYERRRRDFISTCQIGVGKMKDVRKSLNSVDLSSFLSSREKRMNEEKSVFEQAQVTLRSNLGK